MGPKQRRMGLLTDARHQDGHGPQNKKYGLKISTEIHISVGPNSGNIRAF